MYCSIDNTAETGGERWKTSPALPSVIYHERTRGFGETQAACAPAAPHRSVPVVIDDDSHQTTTPIFRLGERRGYGRAGCDHFATLTTHYFERHTYNMTSPRPLSSGV